MPYFLSLALWLFTLCLACFGAAALPLFALEFVVGMRVAAVRPAIAAYARAQAWVLLGNALFTPALCYVMGGLIYRAGQFKDPAAFSQSVWFWAAAWLVGLLLPVQFHFSLNRRLYSTDAAQTVEPRWLPWYWGANALLAATVMWLPLWSGNLTLEPAW